MSLSPRLAVFLTLAAAFFWGSNFSAGKVALADLTPWTASAERFAVAFVGILLVLQWREGLHRAALLRNWRAYLWLGIVGVAGFNGALFVGLQTSSPVTGALIMATTPITTSLIDAGFRRRMPGLAVIVGSLVGVLVANDRLGLRSLRPRKAGAD